MRSTAPSEKFLVVKGEEVTDRFADISLHINGLDVGSEVAPQGGTSVVDVLQRNVNAIRKAGGIPHINHPNFRWSITTDELRQIQNNKLFEIYNGHPEVNNAGRRRRAGARGGLGRDSDEGRPSVRHRRRRCACVQAAGESRGRGARARMGDGARAAPGGARAARCDGARRLLRIDRRGAARLRGDARTR